MTRSRLEVVDSQNDDAQEPSSSVDDNESRLWLRAGDTSVHLFLRELAIIELARRKNPAVLDLCETLLSSGNPDECHVAVSALSEMKTVASLDKLVVLYRGSNPEDRSFIVQKVAECLTSNHAASFEKMLRELSIPCEIDLSRWSSPAKAVLGAVCGRRGLALTYVRTNQGKAHAVIR